MSMVFQNYALYPSMTVYGNLAFALKVRKTPKKEIDQKVHQIAQILDIEHLLDRRPSDLSGGQKQRVSLAGVLIDESPILLFDEPLANLDPKSGQETIDLIATGMIDPEKYVTSVMPLTVLICVVLILSYFLSQIISDMSYRPGPLPHM